MPKLTDESKMKFGIYIHRKLMDVPADYLLFLYDNNKCFPDLREYIEEHKDELEKELNRQPKSNRRKS